MRKVVLDKEAIEGTTDWELNQEYPKWEKEFEELSNESVKNGLVLTPREAYLEACLNRWDEKWDGREE